MIRKGAKNIKQRIFGYKTPVYVCRCFMMQCNVPREINAKSLCNGPLSAVWRRGSLTEDESRHVECQNCFDIQSAPDTRSGQRPRARGEFNC